MRTTLHPMETIKSSSLSPSRSKLKLAITYLEITMSPKSHKFSLAQATNGQIKESKSFKKEWRRIGLV